MAPLVALLLACILGFQAANAQIIASAVGEYPSPSRQCTASLSIGDAGQKILALDNAQATVDLSSIEDVNALVWLNDTELVYSVGPIYGKPGIFVANCMTAQILQLAMPAVFDKAYPDGADYFELHSVAVKPIPVVHYYYSPDVDETDFHTLRLGGNLRAVSINQQ